jgi:hypothetical protein
VCKCFFLVLLPQHFHSRPLGTFFDALSFYEDLWDRYLPEDAHIRASGVLHISITLFPSFQNRVVTNFPTRRELINCICASICLPILFLRSFPRTQYGLAIDGGITNDQPCMDRYTITVSVFNEQADIFPSTRTHPLDVLRIPDLDRAFEVAKLGHQDAALKNPFDLRSEWLTIKRTPTTGSATSGTI